MYLISEYIIVMGDFKILKSEGTTKCNNNDNSFSGDYQSQCFLNLLSSQGLV